MQRSCSTDTTLYTTPEKAKVSMNYFNISHCPILRPMLLLFASICKTPALVSHCKMNFVNQDCSFMALVVACKVFDADFC